MPPKPMFGREEIVQAALQLVSERGMERLTTRGLGERLGSSARPIFTAFKNMEELQCEVKEAAKRRFESYAAQAFDKKPLFKHVGLQMLKFAVEEPKLYQFLFMQENSGADDFEDLFPLLGKSAEICVQSLCEDHGLDMEKARALFENVWIYTFGIGTLCATGACHFSQEKLGEMLSAEFQGMLMLANSQMREGA